MQQDEAREGVDWHAEGADVPGWALVLGELAALGLLVLVLLLILAVG